MMFNLEDTLKNKLGITIDTAATSPSAGGMTFLGPLTEAQRNYVKVGVDDVYTTFTSIVSEGRNLPIEDVYAIAEGRVWSGSNALTIGLVDEIEALHTLWLRLRSLLASLITIHYMSSARLSQSWNSGCRIWASQQL